MTILIPNNKSSLSEWIYYINKINKKPIELGLERVSQVANNLKIFEQPLPFVVTVAGTNGKGTTCCMLETLLIYSNYKVGVFSSPHLINYTERIRIQGIELNESEHIASFNQIEKNRDNILLTFFEFSTLSALLLFNKFNLDFIILEVGLGGRLDATNIINADISIITNIALDHMDVLGNNLDIIGKEKAGIFRSGKIAIIGDKKIPGTVLNDALIKNVNLFQLEKNWHFEFNDYYWSFKDKFGTLNYLPLPTIPISNAATALAALRLAKIEIKEQTIRQYITLANLPGRFQIIQKLPYIILDVAHNPHAAAFLADKLLKFKKYGKLHAVVGMLEDKDIYNTLFKLSFIVDYWYCSTINEPRGASANNLLSNIKKKKHSKTFNEIKDAWYAALHNITTYDVLLVFGSFYTVAEVMKLISLNNIKN